ncbi:hypothetical protein AGR2A_pc0167 [Agrobacterium genomosp. 2 str. CFBP 5494]|uniref:Uncharacterized protein n=1 Tax=Agrobacterium genomosp. 2 str. CFBP 5494 TaxID=1183436 RepID=A0A9W5B8K4_9HYPH|nr:hypothetical protein AGR2A_pc0167 [Agrobacterium genomosp. 2 str. CFBP 5494]
MGLSSDGAEMFIDMDNADSDLLRLRGPGPDRAGPKIFQPLCGGNTRVPAYKLQEPRKASSAHAGTRIGAMAGDGV